MLASCGSPGPDLAQTGASAVIGGTRSPEELGASIHPLQKLAVLAQIVEVGGQRYQGCSATLIGDRVIATAGHCVVANQDAWIDQGARPETVPASYLHYYAGDDVLNPVCVFDAASVRLHPEITVDATVQKIFHDMAVVTLERSAAESCPDAVPIAPNRARDLESLVGEVVFQGGFGSVDGSYDFSPIRFWSAVRISSVDDSHVWVVPTEHGFPTYGDSGSGLLRAF